MILPDWLDKYLFEELGAKYLPSYSDMTNIHDDKEKVLNYLGTYFPRSYAESYSIFSNYFDSHLSEYDKREELSIFDFGCGTGGEIIGLLTVLNEKFRNLKRIRIVALDGNHHALLKYEKILSKFLKISSFEISNYPAAFRIDDLYDLDVLDSVMNEDFDIIMTFKAICEFVTEQQFETSNPYKHIVSFMLPKLKDHGIILLEDVTTKNSVSQEWLPKMMDQGLNAIDCTLVDKNEGYNQTYMITHSLKSNDVSKVAWRIIKR